MTPIFISLLAMISGLALILWSADKFVGSAAVIAQTLKVPAVLIGMVIIGFGTSLPEIVISSVASSNGNAGLALGNAYGSNITNIALVLGLTACIASIRIESNIVRKEIPVLMSVTLLSAILLMDGSLSRLDGVVLAIVFVGLISWSIYQGFRFRQDSFASDVRAEIGARNQSTRLTYVLLVVGLMVLIASSRLFVWGAVTLATEFGVSDLVIGLTIVALGTSLPELASSIMAIKKNEHDLALGNILGSNLFNSLAVVSIVGLIHPTNLPAEILNRDFPFMAILTIAIYTFCHLVRESPRITRIEGALLVVSYFGFVGWVMYEVV